MDSVITQDRLRALAAGHVGRIVAEGAAVYRRGSVLPGLLPLAAIDLSSVGDSSEERRRTRSICLHLARALRRERTRGRAGHWTYDVNRHLALLQAYRAERAELGRLSRPGELVPPKPVGQGRTRRRTGSPATAAAASLACP